MNGPGTVRTIRAALQPHGLSLRGALLFDGDGPRLADGQTARALLLVGHVGSAHWQAFTRWRHRDPDAGHPDPLDRWSKAVIGPLAEANGATAFFPSDPPYQPFQQWAMRAEGLAASPLGILIHPLHGLWHGYRGAIAFAAVPADFEPTMPLGPSPCLDCAGKPCLNACPAGAILADGFQYHPCRSHLARTEGAVCLSEGCLARNACPVGADHRYEADQLRFHMAALKR